VKDIRKRHLEKKYGKPNLKNLRTLAIDEIFNGKGQKTYADKEVITTSILRMRPARLRKGLGVSRYSLDCG
jgi:hypothetical protein